MKKMKMFFAGLILTLIVAASGFTLGGVAIMCFNYKNEPRLVRQFFNPPSQLDLEKDRSVLVAFVKPTLPKVVVETLNRDEMMCVVFAEKFEEELRKKSKTAQVVYQNYPAREKMTNSFALLRT